MRTAKTILALVALASTGCAQRCPAADVSIVAHTGTPIGKEEVHGGGTFAMPTTSPFSY
jgi:hypothetical protein